MKLNELYRFFGGRLCGLMVASIGAGVLLFGVEIGFSTVLQRFFRALFESERRLSYVSPLIGLAFARGLVILVNSGLGGLTSERFKFHQRARMADWVLNENRVSHRNAVFLFNDLVQTASTAVLNFQLSIVSAVGSLGLLFFLFWRAPRETLLVIGIVAVWAFPSRYLNRKIRGIGDSVMNQSIRVNDLFVSTLKSLTLIRIYDLRNQQQNLFLRQLGRHLRAASRLKASQGLALAYPQTFAAILLVLVARICRNDLTFLHTGFISFFYLLYRFLGQVSTFSFVISSFASGYPNLKKLFNWWLNEFSELISQSQRSEAVVCFSGSSGAKIGWQLSDVSFRHSSGDDPIFRHLNLEVPPGHFIALTGPSGSGKTTLLSLLIGEGLPQTGSVRVTYEGTSFPIGECRKALLASIGYVGSESLLIEGTLKENLLYGTRHPVNPNEIRRALDLAGCGFVENLDLGLQHRISESGAGLSSGQKQRLCLARAFLRNPKALILDEPSATLDLASEELLIDSLSRLKGEITIVMTTHRPSFLRLADLHLDLPVSITPHVVDHLIPKLGCV